MGLKLGKNGRFCTLLSGSLTSPGSTAYFYSDYTTDFIWKTVFYPYELHMDLCNELSSSSQFATRILWQKL